MKEKTFFIFRRDCFSYYGKILNAQKKFYDLRLNSERSKPFAEWSVDAVCGWFEEMGLGFYEEDLKKWLKTGGADLLNVTSLDIEKEISLKSPLHRKKIILALNEITGKETDEMSVNAGKLDMVWVSKRFYL